MDILDLCIPSDVKRIHGTVREVERFLDAHETRNTWKISIVLWELLSNAIVHGNANNPERAVKCRVACNANDIITVEVEDEGMGFDYPHMEQPLSLSPRRYRKRGYILIRSICNGITFNENGNHVTAVLDTRPNLMEM